MDTPLTPSDKAYLLRIIHGDAVADWRNDIDRKALVDFIAGQYTYY